MKCVLAITSVWIISFIGLGADADEKQKLLKHFIGKNGVVKTEDKYISPENTNVTISLVIYGILGIDAREVLQFYGWIDVRWNDTRLRWDPLKWSNISTVIFPKEYMWIPDIGIWNSLDTQKIDMLSTDSLTRLEVNSNGSIFAYSQFDSETPCSINGFLYPFDEQLCEAFIGSLASITSEYILHFGSLSVIRTEGQDVGEWSVVQYKVLTKFAQDVLGGPKFRYNRLQLHLRRKPLYHVLLIILPFSLLSLTAAALFFLENSSDRFNISVAVLLSMTLYIVIASQNVPKSMQQIPILGIFMLNQMALLITMTFISALYPSLRKCVHRLLVARRHNISLAGGNFRPNHGLSSSYILLAIYLTLTFSNAFIFFYVIPKTLSVVRI